MEDYKASLMNEQRRAWLDEPLPALDGRTAREAAHLPAWRARLLELVKGQVRQVDQMNLEKGGAEDVNVLIRELGLTEIDFPPPPPRHPVRDAAEGEDDIDDEDDDDEPDFPPPRRTVTVGAAGGWSAPPLPKEPLTFEEASDRLRSGMGAFATAAEAIQELEASGSTMLEDVQALAGGEVAEGDFPQLIVIVIQIWFALVPRGKPAPALLRNAMAAMIERDGAKLLASSAKGTGPLQRLFTDSPQPHLLQLVLGVVVQSAEKAPKGMRPRPESTMGMLLVLKALIAEIDRALRRP
jgi:hypothetical protein